MQKLIEEWRSLDADGSALLIRRGEILSNAKQQLEHGAWLNFLKEIDIPPRTAQRYIRVYQIQANAPTLAHTELSPSQWEQLGRLDEDQLQKFLFYYEDDLQECAVRELQKLITDFLNLISHKKNESNQNRITVSVSDEERELIEYARKEVFPNKSFSEMCSWIVRNFAWEVADAREEKQYQAENVS